MTRVHAPKWPFRIYMGANHPKRQLGPMFGPGEVRVSKERYKSFLQSLANNSGEKNGGPHYIDLM